MKLKKGLQITAKPIYIKNKKTGKVVKFHFSWLPGDIEHRVSKIKQAPFGQLIKTDRLNRWVNASCFIEA